MGKVVLSSETSMEGEQSQKSFEMKKEEVSGEKLVPKMELKVLLVEADDSTRQIVAALLRKCGYRVTSVSDGLKAWETLKENSQNIDLILTEAELPFISGFALLSLITAHEVCKNIPVIMMSTQDSVSLVFKCMLKGASDYLIKPIRRNELSILWQHVWRRHTLIHGQGPEKLTVKEHKRQPVSENNVVSNPSSDCVASTQNTKERSEKGSDVQSSCTTPYFEAESTPARNMQDISHLKYESASNLSNDDVERHGESAKFDEEFENEARENSNTFKQVVASCNGTLKSSALSLKEDHPDESFKVNDSANAEIEDCYELFKPSCGAINLVGRFDDRTKSASSGRSTVDVDGTNYSECAPELELSLRRICSMGSNNKGTGERSTLNHSNVSAFSRYNNNNTLQSFFPTHPSNQTKAEEGMKKYHESLFNQSSENSTGASQQHGDTRNNYQENMSSLDGSLSGQTEASFPSPQLGVIPATGLRFEFFPSLFPTQSSLTQMWSPSEASQQEKSPFPMDTSTLSNSDLHNSEQGYHQSEETTTKSIVDQSDEQGQNNLGAVEEQRTSLSGVAHHLHSSSYGSICGGNDGSASSIHTSQREAALTKFRMKRKDRCFEKKVRYQSRKRLAEQRPRVKGQFVRQMTTDSPVAEADCS
ncbi:hypothetical protein UlMin_021811 [Ulmus minor]